MKKGARSKTLRAPLKNGKYLKTENRQKNAAPTIAGTAPLVDDMGRQADALPAALIVHIKMTNAIIADFP